MHYSSGNERTIRGNHPSRCAKAMAKTDFKSVNDYIASKPKDVRDILKRVRNTICKAVPAAEEVISYQFPLTN